MYLVLVTNGELRVTRACPSFFALRPDWIVNIARPGEAASTRFVPRIAPIRPSIRWSGMKIVGADVACVGDPLRSLVRRWRRASRAASY